MELVSTRVHGMLDYLVGVLLVAAPWLLRFAQGGPETWVPVALGLGVLTYSLLTDYELGAVRAIPMRTHLLLDAISAILLAASPWLFAFAEDVRIPHLILGLFALGTAALTDSQTGATHAPATQALRAR